MKHVITLLCLAFICFSCTKEEKEEKYSPPSVLENCYLEVESDLFHQFAGSGHRFCFEADNSLYLEITYFTDDIDLNNPCPETRTELIEGTYTMDGSTLVVEAEILDIIVSGASSNCPLSTYNKSYVYEDISPTEILLNSDQEAYFQIRLVKE